ncbi:MAG: SPOR domain-containing protein [Sulfuriferula sp.]
MARNTQSRPSTQKKSGSIWSGIMIGVLVGLAAAAAVAVWVGRSNPFAERSAATADKISNAPQSHSARPNDQIVDPLAKATTSANSPHFDFYKILPGNQTSAPEQDVTKSPPPQETAQLYLQAGAFPSAEDADNLKARLALMGYEAAIQTIDIPNKGIWHRVRLGPYKPDELSKIQASLSQNNIPTTLVKIKSQTGSTQPNQN